MQELTGICHLQKFIFWLKGWFKYWQGNRNKYSDNSHPKRANAQLGKDYWDTSMSTTGALRQFNAHQFPFALLRGNLN